MALQWGFTFMALLSLTWARNVTYDWGLSWVTAAPDGFSRPVIGINGRWPNPLVEATVGDTVIVHLRNNLGNQTTGLHFHGIAQTNTPEMDGPVAGTQCPVPPGSSITYRFKVDKPGTYWYHSHDLGQYPDGFRGPMVVHDPQDPYAGEYEEEVMLTLSDWYHEQTYPLSMKMLQPSNKFHQPPLPDSLIVNEGGDGKIKFEKGKTYRLRIVSFAALASTLLHFDSHTMQVIMQDGSYITKHEAYQLRIAPAQRYDILITALDRDHRNYPFLASLDAIPDFANAYGGPSSVQRQHNFTGYLVMDEKADMTRKDVVDIWRPVDDFHFAALRDTYRLPLATQTIVLDFQFCFDNYSIPRACFNHHPYVPQDVPTLYSVATTGENNTNPIIYGGVNPIMVKQGTVVDLVINNRDIGTHPFHLHNHQFQVLDRPKAGTGVWPGTKCHYPDKPASKDTIAVNGHSYAVLRYQAVTPGVSLFHCHIEWHVEMGLTATIIQGAEALRGMKFPADHIDNCEIQGIPFQGNAAGNLANVTDTTGMKFVNDPVYKGSMYTPRLPLSPSPSQSPLTLPSGTLRG